MIHIRSKSEIEHIRKSCQIVIETFKVVDELIEPGITTQKINKEIERYIKLKKAKPAFKGYNGFPASSCISVDDEVVHGIPGNRVLKDGDIVSIDIGVEFEGFFGDGAKTYAVGDISKEKKRLMMVTLDSLNQGVKQAVPGSRLSNISHKVQTIVESANFSVVRDLVGHGIGRKLHEDPQVPNYGNPNTGPRLRSGMVLAIEPMVNIGGYQVKTTSDNWTVITEDGSPSAHFEHTIAVNKDGPEILTLGI